MQLDVAACWCLLDAGWHVGWHQAGAAAPLSPAALGVPACGGAGPRVLRPLQVDQAERRLLLVHQHARAVCLRLQQAGRARRMGQALHMRGTRARPCMAGAHPAASTGPA